jgi:hypothetical protein
MQKRTIVAIVLLVAAAAVMAVVKTRSNPHRRELPRSGQSAAGAPAPLAVAEVDAIEIEEAGKPRVALAKQDGAWRVVAPVADAADEKNVEQALKTLGEITWKNVVAESKDSHEKLQVRDGDVTKVTVKKGETVLLALWVGKTNKVRVAGEDKVWDVGRLNRFALSRDLKLWRRREVFRFEKKDLQALRVELRQESGAWHTLVVGHAEEQPPPPPPAPEGQLPPPLPPAKDVWTVQEGQALVGGALDESVASGVTAALSRLDVAEFADDVTPAAAGLDNPRARLTAVLASGDKKVLEIGGPATDTDTYVRVAGESRVFRLRKSATDNMTRPLLQWRDKTVVAVDGKDVARIEVAARRGELDERLVLERVDDKTWKIVEPRAQSELDSGKAQGLAGSFARVRAQSIADLAPADAKAAFAKPAATITLVKKDGAKVVLTVGTMKDTSYHVKVSTRPEVFLLPDVTVKRWMAGPDDYKPPAPLAPGQAGLDPHGH